MLICDCTRNVFNYTFVYVVAKMPCLLCLCLYNRGNWKNKNCITLHVNAKYLVHANQNLEVLPPFDTRHQDHVNPHPSCDWLIQVCTLHYILLSQLEVFSLYTYNISHGSSFAVSRRRWAGSLARWLVGNYSTLFWKTPCICPISL